MDQQIIYYLTSVVLGAMLFFSFVIAPTIFRVLDENYARKFIRKIFPLYYSFCLIILFITSLLYIYFFPVSYEFYILLFLVILFSISLFVLMPMINKFRDNKLEKKFKTTHTMSVLINFIQMIGLIVILF
mgnify:FL=1|jgi:uncharacterized membrane protein|tara:strand:+ start:939 stop:1328 length:390 start_codon:yes stop_codon:yes gene_type:complete